MKLQSRACQSDPFSLSVCFSSHPPLADTAAPNFSQRSIRINLIKTSKEKKKSLKWIPMSFWTISPSVCAGLQRARLCDGVSLNSLEKMSPPRRWSRITQMNFHFKGQDGTEEMFLSTCQCAYVCWQYFLERRYEKKKIFGSFSVWQWMPLISPPFSAFWYYL